MGGGGKSGGSRGPSAAEVAMQKENEKAKWDLESANEDYMAGLKDYESKFGDYKKAEQFKLDEKARQGTYGMIKSTGQNLGELKNKEFDTSAYDTDFAKYSGLGTDYSKYSADTITNKNASETRKINQGRLDSIRGSIAAMQEQSDAWGAPAKEEGKEPFVKDVRKFKRKGSGAEQSLLNQDDEASGFGLGS